MGESHRHQLLDPLVQQLAFLRHVQHGIAAAPQRVAHRGYLRPRDRRPPVCTGMTRDTVGRRIASRVRGDDSDTLLATCEEVIDGHGQRQSTLGREVVVVIALVHVVSDQSETVCQQLLLVRFVSK